MNEKYKDSIFSLSKDQMTDFLVSQHQSKHLAVSIYESLYKNNSKQNISNKTWSILRNNFSFDLPEIVETNLANDGTYKFLVEFSDKKRVETVLIPFHKRYTICLSSQVG
ncbi:MAG: 23S rRNA (adenine(2503)-C(2))-methyltransferase RlmN, partial [Bacteriovorax sp.]|nr:23S rRNA (adenine(2503)-C(2))-methyltransferase RlmN [Bacteriovorax sp.]